MDYELARFNMIEQQIRTWNVLNARILDAFFKVKREQFVPAGMETLAFSDIEIPLPHGQYMFAPKIEGRLLQAALISEQERVLIIGAGSGHFSALAATLGQHVTAIEINADLAAMAQRNLARSNITNVTIEVGDAAQGWPTQSAWDVIIATGSWPQTPPALIEQLAPQGRLIAVTGSFPIMQAQCLTRKTSDTLHSQRLFETVLRPLSHTQPRSTFAL